MVSFQTIPLLELGYNVTAIDLSEQLLYELDSEHKNRASNISTACKLVTIQGDLLAFKPLVGEQKFATIVCMGDTLTHLASLEEVNRLIYDAFAALNINGQLILQFRDLTQPLAGTDRFIPVRSDERTVFTCFLEWDRGKVHADGSGCTVKVHDLVHVKKGIGAWELLKSWYLKLGITMEYVSSLLSEVGFLIDVAANGFYHLIVDSGMVTLVATKRSR